MVAVGSAVDRTETILETAENITHSAQQEAGTIILCFAFQITIFLRELNQGGLVKLVGG